MASRSPALASHRGSRAARIALIWLAVVLAIAQTVAIRHAHSHNADETSSQSAAKHSGGLAHCQSCIVAAAIGGAAPPTPALLLAAVARHLPQVFAAAERRLAPQQRPYAIRAPPFLVS